jgi:predicted house-cleaning noncanonical NTP pyrophosphatase (MazG superfamily)
MAPITNHYKLVRDRIPERMRLAGKETTIRRLEATDDFVVKVGNNIIEEAHEVQDALFAADKRYLLAEIADLQDVLNHLMYAYGFNSLQVDAAISLKHRTHGGFSDRVFLMTSRPACAEGEK